MGEPSRYKDEVIVTPDVLDDMKNGVEYVAVNWEQLQKNIAHIKSLLSPEQYKEVVEHYNFDSSEMAVIKQINPAHKSMRFR